MGLDTELTGILRDVVQFLQCLREIKLPANLECIRNNLLIRSKYALPMFMEDRLGGSNSSEPYLNMNAARPKGLTASSSVFLKTEAEIQEYVGAEEPRTRKYHHHHHHHHQQQHQDYYETLQTIESAGNVSTVNETVNIPDKEEEIENTLLNAYANLSAVQAKNKCEMYGSLDRREGKKLFVFEQYRPCWVGLLGLHLLIYGSDRDNRPCTILSIRGYMARAAPNAIPRDHRRSESTFEIFRPGSRTYQFIARTPQNMEEWIGKICELASAEKAGQKTSSKAGVNVSVESDTIHPDDEENPNCKQERYQDVGLLTIDNISEGPLTVLNAVCKDSDKETSDSSLKDTFRETDSPSLLLPSSSLLSIITPVAPSILSPPPPPPPLPSPPPSFSSASSFSQIPRKLPSLPSSVHRSSYEFLEEEEDDIYHKIEDFGDSTRYGNVGEIRTDIARPTREPVTYDVCCANIKGESKTEHERRRKSSENTVRKSLNLRNETTYDDTTSIVSKDSINIPIDERDKFLSYDDVENLALARSIKVRVKDKTEKADKTDESTKSPQKKSFLDRVRSRRESPKKNEKKVKYKIPTLSSPSVVIDQVPPTYYDDVSDLTKTQQMKRFDEEKEEDEDSEYTCPPAPRPIYVKPPTIVDNTVINSQEFYDDVSTYRERYEEDRDRNTCKFDQLQPSPRKQNYGHGHGHGHVIMDTERSVLCENIQDNEHYKTPRIDTSHTNSVLIEQRDQLYDDIAILADFTARQKEYFVKKDNEETTKLQVGPEKRSWNRFVSGRKCKTFDSTTVSEANGRTSNGAEDTTDDVNEQQGSMRMNTIQKLISRMENSFGKVSVRSASSVLLNKSNVINNA